jgi:hypothetical protein
MFVCQIIKPENLLLMALGSKVIAFQLFGVASAASQYIEALRADNS